MKVSVNDAELFTLSDIKKQVIAHDINVDTLEDDLKRRLRYILKHKYERCLARLKEQWIPKLKENGVTEIPLDDDAFAQLVFDQPNYKDKKEREAEESPK